MIRGEDYSAYIEWVDEHGDPVTAVDGSKAAMKVSDPASGNIVMDFQEDHNVDLEPVANVLGSTGIIRITAPKAVTERQTNGTYLFDLVVDHIDADRLVFTGGQRKFVISGDFVIADRFTG